MDRITKEHRRWNMSRLRSRDTTPERRVRAIIHRRGMRFTLARKGLPGSPDIILPRRGAVVFVHGCFWHRHPCCRNAKLPRTRTDFWSTKLSGNLERDHRNVRSLEAMGWKVVIVWECELRDEEALGRRLECALGQLGG